MKLKAKIVPKTVSNVKTELPVAQCPPGLYPWINDSYFLVLETTDGDNGTLGVKAYFFISSTGEMFICQSPKHTVDANKRIPNFEISLIG